MCVTFFLCKVAPAYAPYFFFIPTTPLVRLSITEAEVAAPTAADFPLPQALPLTISSKRD